MDSIDKAVAVMFSVVAVCLMVFTTVFLIDEFAYETKVEVIKLDSGASCVVTTKGNSVTNLECEG